MRKILIVLLLSAPFFVMASDLIPYGYYYLPDNNLLHLHYAKAYIYLSEDHNFELTSKENGRIGYVSGKWKIIKPNVIRYTYDSPHPPYNKQVRAYRYFYAGSLMMVEWNGKQLRYDGFTCPKL